MPFLDTIQTYFATGVGSIVKALLLLILAFIVAAAARAAIRRLLSTQRLGAALAKADPPEKPGATADYIARFVYFIVFLLFVPGIMSALHAEAVSQPILNLLNTIWGYVPSVIAAAIVLVAGVFIARLARQLLIPVFQKLRVDKLQEKAGMEVTDSAKLSNTLAYIVYVIILIPVIIVALETLNIQAISEPAVNMLGIIFEFLPRIVAAALIITVGAFIGKFAGQIVQRLIASTGVDQKLGDLAGGKTRKFVLSSAVGVTVHALVVIFFTVEGVNVLNLDVLTNIGASIISYLPNVLAAAIVLILAILATRLAERAMKRGGFEGYILPVKAAIFAIAGFMILNQLGIASRIVNTAFIAVLAAAAVAFALAFGIGGKDFAAKTLARLSDKTEKKDQ